MTPVPESEARETLRRVLATLAASPARITSLGDTMPCAVYLLDIQRGELAYDNGHIAIVLGSARSDELRFAERMHPGDAKQMFAELPRWNAVDDGEVVGTRFRLRDAGGQYRWFLALSTLESRDDEGRAERVLGCATRIEEPRGILIPPSADDIPEEKTATVLLVEDHRDLLGLTTRVLLEAGYQVLTSESAFEALGHRDAALTGVGVVVSDVELPDLSGPELVERLAERGLTAPVVYISGHPPGDAFASAVRGTRYDLLRKPFVPAQLLARVAAALEV